MYKKKAGKLQTGITFPKQYWLAVNGKPKTYFNSWLSYSLKYDFVITREPKIGILPKPTNILYFYKFMGTS